MSKNNPTSTSFIFAFKDFFRQVVTLFSAQAREKDSRNTTNLQVIQKQYISSVWCPITIVARIESFPGVPLSARDLFTIALSILKLENALFLVLALKTPLTDFCCFQIHHQRFHRSDKTLVQLFFMKSENVVQALIKNFVKQFVG